MDALKELLKQPYRVIAMILDVGLVSFPCVTIDKEYHWTTHQPNTFSFGYTFLARWYQALDVGDNCR
jgi:hypothetical protein